MKNNLKKAIALILGLILCAAATIAGFAASAATHSNAAVQDVQDAESASRPALKDGVWEAVAPDGNDMLFFIDENEHRIALISPDLGIGLPSDYAYNSATGIYKIQLAYEGNEKMWRVIDNNGRTAVISDENGDLIELYYIDNKTIDEFQYYTLNELSGMARGYYLEHNGSSEGVSFSARMTEDGSFFAVITVEKDGAVIDRYSVDMQTGSGTDSSYNAVNLSAYAASAE